MPRRKKTSFTRDVGVDLVYQSEVIQKLINMIMTQGKKETAQRIVYGALDILAQKTKGDKQQAFELFEKAFNQVIPSVEVRPRRVGGSVYQIPVAVQPWRARALAFRWIIKAAASRPAKSMDQRLAQELMDAAEGRGGAMKKKMEVHKMAESNRAFSHYAW